MRIVRYLKALEEKDWKNFRTYIDQKTKNRSDLRNIFQYIIKNRSKDLTTFLNPQQVKSELRLSKDRKAILNLYSDCVQVIKEFLIQEQLKDEVYEKQILLLKALNKRRLYSEADRLVKIFDDKFDSEKLSWWNDLYHQRIHHEHYFSDNPSKNNQSFHELQNMINSARAYHEQIRALYHFEIQNNLKLNKLLYNNIEDDYSIHKSKSSTKVSEILNSLIIIRTKNDLETATQVRDFLYTNHAKLNTELRLLVYLVLRMFYAREANLGNLNRAEDVFELHKLMVDKRYIAQNNQISEFQFLAIIELASFLNKIEWGYKFLRENKNMLPLKQRREIIELSRAYLLFGNQEYQNSLSCLQSIYPKSPRVRSMTHRLEILNYFKLFRDDIIFLKSKLKNYRLYNYRNKKQLSKKAYLGSTNFGIILKLFINKEKKDVIKKKMEEMDILFYRIFFHNEIKNGSL